MKPPALPGVVSLCAVGSVGSWCDLGYGLDGAIGQPGQHVDEVFADGDIEPAAALDNREDSGDLRTGLLTTEVQPVHAAKSDSTDILPISVMN